MCSSQTNIFTDRTCSDLLHQLTSPPPDYFKVLLTNFKNDGNFVDVSQFQDFLKNLKNFNKTLVLVKKKV